jgi:hypothetical protein
MMHATKIDSMLQSPPKKRPQTTISTTQTNKENEIPSHQDSTSGKLITVTPFKPLAAHMADSLLFTQVQEEFKKQQVRNANFDNWIKKLETTTNKIDINVDQILDLMESSSKKKAPRVTENMPCDTEDFPSFNTQSNQGDDDL